MTADAPAAATNGGAITRPGGRSRTTSLLALALVLVLGGALAAWVGSPGPAGTARPLALLTSHVVTPALVAALCLVPARRSTTASDRLGWVLMALSVATWGGGSAVFAWYRLTTGEAPFPSLADLLYLAYALPALAGLFAFSWSVPHAVSRFHTFVDGLTITAGLLLLTWDVLLRELADLPRGVAWAVTLAYPVLDTTIAAVVLSLAWRQVRARYSWALVGGGLLLVALCDLFYVREGLAGTLVVGEGFWQAGYTVGFLLVGAAALAFESTVPLSGERVQDHAGEQALPAESVASDVGSQAVVYAVLVAAIVAAVATPRSAWEDPLLVGLAVATAILAIAREALVVADAATLRTDLERVVSERTAALQASRARLQAVTETASDAIVVIDGAGEIRAWNVGAEHLFGCSSDAAVGREMAEFLPVRDRPGHRAGVQRQVTSPSSDLLKAVEVSALRTDGREVPVELSLSAWEVDGERFFTGILRDISERRRAEERQAREAAHMALVQQVAVAANGSVDVASAFATSLRHVCETFGWPLGHAFLVEDGASGSPLRSLDWHTEEPERYQELIDLSERISFAEGIGIVGLAMASRAPVWMRSSDPDARLPRAPMAMKVGLRSFHAFPVWWNDRLVAILEFFSTDEVEPDASEFRLLGLIGTQLGRVVERHAAEGRLSRLAHHDALTGLANRLLFQQRVEDHVGARSEAGAAAVVLLDLDGFKEVNDSMGHAAGDELLVEVARRLVAVSRRDDTVARLGGDEFAVVTRGVSDPADLEAHVRRLLESLTRPVILQGRKIRPGASVGVAVRQADESAEVLLRNADLAMYEAKAAGKGRFAFFEPRMHEEVTEKLELESGISFALDNRELCLMYRPVVSLASGLVAAREAVLRWRHPTRGLVDPEPLLQQPQAAAVEARVQQWVLERALSDAAAWRMEGEEVALHLRLPTRGVSSELVAGLDTTRQRVGFPAEDVMLLVPDHRRIGSSVADAETLEALHRLHVGITVEELGTGDATLSRLRDLPVRELRIGSHLVAGLPDEPMARALAEAVLSMSLTLEVGVVAVGVERREQLDFLRARGCAAVQGPLIGLPAPYGERARGRVLPAQPGSPDRGWSDPTPRV